MIIGVLKKVFAKPIYLSIALTVSYCIFVIVTVSPNLQLVKIVFGSDTISFSQKLSVLISLTGAIKTNFTVLGAVSLITLAVLSGMYVSMLIYLIKNKLTNQLKSRAVTGILASISGIIGIGCMACGTFLLSSLIPVISTPIIIKYLPLAGGEFTLVGIVLLIFALYQIAKQVDSANVCVIKN